MRLFNPNGETDAAEALRRLVAECNAGGTLPSDLRRVKERVPDDEDAGYDYGLPPTFVAALEGGG